MNLRSDKFVNSNKKIEQTNIVTILNLRNKQVCVTGKIGNYSRYDVELWLINKGAIPVPRVTSTTNILIIGKNPGKTKTDACSKYMIDKIYEKDIINILKEDLKLFPYLFYKFN